MTQRITRYLFCFFILCAFTPFLMAQVAINTDNGAPDASAMLDIKSTDKGVLIPRVTTAQRDLINLPATGLMIYNTSDNQFHYYNGTSWIIINTGIATSIADADNNTKVEVEETTNDNIIRFNVDGTGVFSFSKNANGDPIMSVGSSNTIIGESAGIANTGDSNIFIGRSAGRVNTSGRRNSIIGSQAGLLLTTGSFNTYFGTIAGRDNTTGSRNTFIGDSAGSGPSGSGNTYLGMASGALSGGNDNTFIGDSAGGNNAAGNNNTMVGVAAGLHSNGTGNIFLGHFAGASSTGDNKLHIDNSGTTSPLIYGDFATDTVKIYGTLGVKDEYHFPITDGTNGQTLKTDGSGNLSWQNEDTLSIIADADNDTKIETEAMPDEDIIRFTVNGTEALNISKNAGGYIRFNTPRNSANLLIGDNAGISLLPESSGNNTFIGVDAGEMSTTSSNNIFMGFASGFLNTTGSCNVAVGTVAGFNMTTGYNNVFLGEQSGYDVTTGGENTLVGAFSGPDLRTGIRNVFVGTHAGFTNRAGSGNVFLGFDSGSYELGSNKLYIDNTDTASPLIYGDFSKDSLSVNGSLTTVSSSARPLLIQHKGTGNGAYLEVNNASGTRALFGVDGNGFSGGDTTDVSIANWSNGDLVLHTNATEQMRITASGRVGIGRTATTNILEVNGQASKTTAGSWVANSDARLKKNITSLASEKMLYNLLSLKGMTYEWNDTITGNNRPEGIQYGFTAQNIQEVFPTLVEEDNQGFLQTAYGTYDAMMVEAIRALNNKIESLEQEKSDLTKKVENLAAQVAKVDALEGLVKQLLQNNTSPQRATQNSKK